MYDVSSLCCLQIVPRALWDPEHAPRGKACPYSRSAVVSWELCREGKILAYCGTTGICHAAFFAVLQGLCKQGGTQRRAAE